MRWKIGLIGVISLLIFLNISNVSGFKDSFQYQSESGLTLNDLWVTEKGSDSIIEIGGCGGYTDGRCLHLKAISNEWAKARNKDPSPSNYWSFILRGYSHSAQSELANGYVYFYNESLGCIFSKQMTTYFDTYHSSDLYEFIREDNVMYLRINGTNMGNIGECNETPAYIEIAAQQLHTSTDHWTSLSADDVTNENGMVGIINNAHQHTITELASDEIVGEYSIVTIPKTSYDGAEYCMKVKRFTSSSVINSTVIKEAGNSTAKPCGFVEYNRTELFENNYGLYLFYVTKNGEIESEDYLFFKPLTDDSIYFDKETYAVGETAIITYAIDNPDFTSYDYYVRIYDSSGNRLKSVFLTESSGSVEWNTEETTEGGLYYTTLEMIGDGSYELAFDMASVAEEVRIQGTTYNAQSESILGTVNASLLQNEVYYNTTSNASTGEYNITDLTVDAKISVNASKTNYIHNDFSFTPLQNGLYNINLFLLPDENHININPPAIVGLVQSYPFYQNVSEATVNLWNTSIGLTTSNITNSMGYFEFTLDNTSMQTSDIVNETFNSSEYNTWVNLANSGIVQYSEKVTNTTDEIPYQRGTDYEMDYVAGKIKVLSTGNMSNNTEYHIDYEKYETTTFTINATKFKYEQMNQPQTFTVNATEIKYVYLSMNPIYNLTVRARSAETHATIMEFDVMLNDGDIQSTTTGSITFSVNYGIHKIEVGADGYYSTVAYIYVSEDTEKVVYLTPLEEGGGAGTYYPPPHLVEFKVQNVWGQPLSGVNVTAVPAETSMVNWSWIESVYGYGENISQTMTGITDSNGAVSFVMVETVKYKLYFTNESQNISAYREIYPKDDRYTITIGEIPEEKIGWWLSTAQNDSANTGNITIHYLDYNEPVKTQWVNFSIYYLDNDTLVYSHNFTTVNATNENASIDLNASYAYKVKITAYHEDYGIISSTTIIVFVIPEKPKLPVVQELFKHLEPWQITLISMFVLICFGFIFGAVSAGTGGLIVAAMAAAFYYFGLLPSLSKEVASIVIPLMLIVAVLNKLIEQRGVIQE